MFNFRRKTVIVAIVLVAVATVSIYTYRVNSRNSVDLLVSRGNMINILLMGSNKYTKNKMSFYAIMSINAENNTVGLTFLPPSLKVDLTGDGDLVRIDQVDSRDFRKLSQYLFNSLNLRINFYVSFFAPDVERVVNLINGVNLYVVDQVKDIDGVSPGLNYFDGKKVVQYINQAGDGTIYRKYDRIQDILCTLFYNSGSYKDLLDKEFIAEAVKTVSTNLTISEINSLVKIVTRKGDIMCTMLPGKITPEGDYIIDEVAYKIYENEFLKKLVIKRDSETNIKVKVLNASGVSGLAKKMRSLFVKEGVTVVEFGTYPGGVLDQSVIINQSGNIESVRKVSDLSGVHRIYHIIDSSQISSVVFIAGKDVEE